MSSHQFSIVLDGGTTTDEASLQKKDGKMKIIGPHDTSSHQTNSTTTTTLSSLSQISQKRQKIMEETQRVMRMHQMTQNPSVKASCEMRLKDLKHTLEGLTLSTPVSKESFRPTSQLTPPNHLQSHQPPQEQPEERQPVEDTHCRTKQSVVASVVQPNQDSLQNLTTTVGRWNTHVWSFLQFGLFHPTVMLSFFFPFLALAQVMMRLDIARRPWIGIPDRTPRSRDAFRIALVLEMIWATINCFIYYLPNSLPVIPALLFWLWNGSTFLYLVINVLRIRTMVRERYQIPTNFPQEDYVVASFLSLLAIMQLLRQTADYNTYSASCFSENGMPAHVPIAIPKSTKGEMSQPIAHTL